MVTINIIPSSHSVIFSKWTSCIVLSDRSLLLAEAFFLFYNQLKYDFDRWEMLQQVFKEKALITQFIFSLIISKSRTNLFRFKVSAVDTHNDKELCKYCFTIIPITCYKNMMQMILCWEFMLPFSWSLFGHRTILRLFWSQMMRESFILSTMMFAGQFNW